MVIGQGFLTHGPTAAGEEVDQGDDELLLCIVLPPLPLLHRLGQEHVDVASHLKLRKSDIVIVIFKDTTSPSLKLSFASFTKASILPRNLFMFLRILLYIPRKGGTHLRYATPTWIVPNE